jgi:hypothetical protein
MSTENTSVPRRDVVRQVSGAGARCGCGKPSALRVVQDDKDYFLCRACTIAAVTRYVRVAGQPRFGEAATAEYVGTAR